MNTKAAFLDRIFTQIDQLKEAPLFGKGIAFDWEHFSSLLGQELGVSGLLIRLKKQEFKEDLTIKPLYHAIQIAPIDEPLFWKMSKTDRDLLTAKILSGKPRKKAFTSSVLQEGFYRFLLLEALNVLGKMEPLEQMSLQLVEEGEKLSDHGFLLDVEIIIDETSCWGQLVISEKFRKKWVQHFAAFPSRYIPTKLAQSLELFLGVEIGSVALDLKTLQTLKKGDFILPDHLYNPSHAILTLKQMPLFRLKRETDQVIIHAYAFTTEENMEDTENLSQALEKADQESSTLKELPIHVRIEIDRLQMTLDELMNLSPGNVLELSHHADKKVWLTVHGKKIGVAELVQLGETLGIKILEI